MSRKRMETALMAGLAIALLGILVALVARNLQEVDTRAGWTEEETDLSPQSPAATAPSRAKSRPAGRLPSKCACGRDLDSQGEPLEGRDLDSQGEPLEEVKPVAVITEVPEERAESYPLTDEEFYAVCAVVMAESGAEPYEGQMAVAWCIRNACEGDHVDPIYVLNNYGYTKPKSTWTESVSKAVNAVFWNGEKVVDEPIRYFYAPKLCEGGWHESAREFVCEIGGHRFFQ